MSEFENKKPDENSQERDPLAHKSRYDPLARTNTPEAQSDTVDGEIKIKSPFLSKLENFWYHYKWHSIIAAFVIIAILICSLQMCTKTTYDMYIMYAGGTDVRMTAESGTESHFEKLLSATRKYVPDTNNDGERNLSMINLYLPSSEQIKEIENDPSGNLEVNYSVIAENTENFEHYMLFGEYYICILSKHLVDEWTKNTEAIPFVPISPYLPDGAKVSTDATQAHEENTYVLANQYAVYLYSTPLANKPGYNNLGDDTVICMRTLSELNTRYKGEKNKEYYRNSENVIRNMLADKAYE